MHEPDRDVAVRVPLFPEDVRRVRIVALRTGDHAALVGADAVVRALVLERVVEVGGGVLGNEVLGPESRPHAQVAAGDLAAHPQALAEPVRAPGPDPPFCSRLPLVEAVSCT